MSGTPVTPPAGWKGVSTLELSTDNIITAIQMWLDSNFAPGGVPAAREVRYDFQKQKYTVTLGSPEMTA